MAVQPDEESATGASVRPDWNRINKVTWSLVGLSLLTVGSLWLLGRLWTVLLPLAIGLLAVFFLRPIVEWMIERRFPRVLAAIVAYVSSGALLAGPAPRRRHPRDHRGHHAVRLHRPARGDPACRHGQGSRWVLRRETRMESVVALMRLIRNANRVRPVRIGEPWLARRLFQKARTKGSPNVLRSRRT